MRAVALLALWAGLVGMACVGAVKLDARYLSTRFEAERIDICPLALVGVTATPMCRPSGPGW